MSHPWNPRLFAKEARTLGRSKETIEAAVAAARAIKNADPELPVILSLSHLAHLAGIDPGKVREHAARTWGSDPYRVFRLKKRRRPGATSPARAFRVICVPDPELMRLQRWIAQNVLSRAVPHGCSHAFHPARGILDAARRHCGCRWLVKLDIRGFFDSITERRCYAVFRSMGYGALVSFELARICTRVPIEGETVPRTSQGGHMPYARATEGRLPQGAPTSPALANMAVHSLDGRLHALAASRGWIYTRYADDLAFSTKGEASRAEALGIIGAVKARAAEFGLELNGSKTVIAPPGARRVVLGLLVDGHEPRLTRAFRNNLDTHLHALTRRAIGPERHRKARGFASLIGMRRHVGGLIAFAHQIEPSYAAQCWDRFGQVEWPL